MEIYEVFRPILETNERKNCLYTIDLVCENEFRNTLEFVEVKRNVERIDLNALRLK